MTRTAANANMPQVDKPVYAFLYTFQVGGRIGNFVGFTQTDSPFSDDCLMEERCPNVYCAELSKSSAKWSARRISSIVAVGNIPSLRSKRIVGIDAIP